MQYKLKNYIYHQYQNVFLFDLRMTLTKKKEKKLTSLLKLF